MKTTIPTQTAFTSNSTFIAVGFIATVSLFISIIALSEFRFPSNLFFYPTTLLMFGVSFYYKYTTYLRITPDKVISRSFKFFITKKQEMPFTAIDMVRRIRPNVFLGLGVQRVVEV